MEVGYIIAEYVRANILLCRDSKISSWQGFSTHFFSWACREENLLVMMMPPNMRALPIQKSQENRSLKMMRESMTAKTGVR
jgi:hypothetical protein